MLLSACATSLHIPEELLRPCWPDSDKPIVTNTDAVEAYAAVVTALSCANGRIEAIAEIYGGATK